MNKIKEIKFCLTLTCIFIPFFLSTGTLLSDNLRVKVDEEFTIRHIYKNNVDANPYTDDAYDYYSQRLRILFGLFLPQNIEFITRLQALTKWGVKNEKDAALPYPDTSFIPWIDTAYLKIKDLVIPNIPVLNIDTNFLKFALTLGRQQISLFDGLLFDDNTHGIDMCSVTATLWDRIQLRTFFGVVSENTSSKHHFQYYSITYSFMKNVAEGAFFKEIRGEVTHLYTLFSIKREFVERINYEISIMRAGETSLSRGQWCGKITCGYVFFLPYFYNKVKCEANFIQGLHRNYSPLYPKKWDGVELDGLGKIFAANFNTLEGLHTNPEVTQPGLRTFSIGTYVEIMKNFCANVKYYGFELIELRNERKDIGTEIDLGFSYSFSNYLSLNFVYALAYYGKLLFNAANNGSNMTWIEVKTKF
jgi:hypothetical protein